MVDMPFGPTLYLSFLRGGTNQYDGHVSQHLALMNVVLPLLAI
jgi:hypothetical protein